VRKSIPQKENFSELSRSTLNNQKEAKTERLMESSSFSA
jgi:hypothetical protein